MDDLSQRQLFSCIQRSKHLISMGRAREAIGLLLDALKLSPSDNNLFCHLSEAFLALNEKGSQTVST